MTPFSIIIPTYNRASKVCSLVESIYKYIPEDLFELIVVIDGSTDNTLEILQTYQKSNLVIINQANSGRSAARNVGANRANNQYLLFLDDDIRLFNNILPFHLENQTHEPCLLNGKLEMDNMLLKNDFLTYRHHLLGKYMIPTDSKIRITAKNYSFTTQHLSIPKQLFEQLGGFNEKLTDAEDYDLAMRALDANIPIYYDPTICVFLDDFADCRMNIQRQIEYKKSHIRLKELGKKYKTPIFEPLQKPKGSVKCFILKILATDLWVNLIDDNKFVWLPKAFRYKLYSTVTYAHTLKGLGLI